MGMDTTEILPGGMCRDTRIFLQGKEWRRPGSVCWQLRLRQGIPIADTAKQALGRGRMKRIGSGIIYSRKESGLTGISSVWEPACCFS